MLISPRSFFRFLGFAFTQARTSTSLTARPLGRTEVPSLPFGDWLYGILTLYRESLTISQKRPFLAMQHDVSPSAVARGLLDV